MEKWFLDETIKKGTLASGMQYVLLPKELYAERMAMVTVRYGAADRWTASGGEDLPPEGIAHFLEHKLFENPDGNAFEQFSRLGAYANAFTSFNNTAYYFTCHEQFGENLRTLLEMVSTPYFTEETVQKEMGIIEQEIRMYEDNPAWSLYFGMLSGLYRSERFRSIAGTPETIRAITPEALYRCYENFYRPEHMTLICAGAFDTDETLGIAERYIKAGGGIALRKAPKEDGAAVLPIHRRTMPLSNPLFQIGIKDRVFARQAERSCIAKTAMDLLVGESSALKERWTREGIADEGISFDYTYGEGYGYASISGQGASGAQVAEECLAAVEKIRKEGLPEAEFNRIKKKQLGAFIRGLNDIEAMTMASAELALWGADLSDCYQQYTEMKREDCSRFLSEIFDERRMTVSLLAPKGEEDAAGDNFS